MPAVTKHRFLIGHRLDCPKIGILASSLEPGPPDRRPVAQPQVGQSNRNRSLLASSVPVFTANFLDVADEAQAILLAIGPSSPRPDRGALACLLYHDLVRRLSNHSSRRFSSYAWAARQAAAMERGRRPPDMSNFCCLPGRAGGTPMLV